MKKINFISLIVATLLCGCGTGVSSSQNSSPNSSSESGTSSSIDGSSSSSSNIVPQPSIKEVFTRLKQLDNYTLKFDDQFLNSSMTYQYTSDAVYVTNINKKGEEESYGYANSKNNEVFGFTIENDKINPTSALKDNQGTAYTDWRQMMLSLNDIDLDFLSDEASSDNKYQIKYEEDLVNYIIFVGLAGWFDVMGIQYVTAYCEITGENDFVISLYFDTGTDTSGYCYITLEDVGETQIPLIQEYINEGKGPKVDESSKILQFMTEVKGSQNFKVEVTTSTSKFIDIFNEDYYFTYDLLNESTNSGYAVIKEKIYNITKSNGAVQLGNEITYTSSDKSDLWGNVLTNKSFANINLSSANFNLTENEGKYDLAYDYGVYTILLAVTHTRSIFGPAAPNENDKVYFTLGENLLTYNYLSEVHGNFVVTISELGLAKDLSIEEFIASTNENTGLESSLSETLNSVKTSKNYTMKLTDNFAYANALLVGSTEIKFTEKHIYLNNLEDSSKSYGYYCDGFATYKYNIVEEKATKLETNMTTNPFKLMKSFADISLDNLPTESEGDGSYIINDSSFITTLGEIFNLSASAFPIYFSSIKVVCNEGSIRFTNASSGFYGSFVIEIYDIGSTTLTAPNFN